MQELKTLYQERDEIFHRKLERFLNDPLPHIKAEKQRPLTEKEKKILKDYDQHNRVVGGAKSIETRTGYLFFPRKIFYFFGSKLDQATRKNVEDFLSMFSDKSEGHQLQIRLNTKKFFQWYIIYNKQQKLDERYLKLTVKELLKKLSLKEKDNELSQAELIIMLVDKEAKPYKRHVYPELVDWIELKSIQNGKLPEELITPEEVKRMVQVSDNFKNKALIVTLYESGCRKSEVLGLQIKHLTFDSYGGQILVRGKTGQRRIRLLDSVPYLKDHLESHPHRDNPEAPLFLNHYSRTNKAVGRDALDLILDTAVKRAGIKKHIYCHLLRHSRLTEMAKLLTEAELKIYAGWTPNSNMAKTYIHLSGQDVDRKILEKAGVLKEEDKAKEKQRSEALKPLTCGRCNKKNPATSLFCNSCALPLTVETVMDIDKDMNEVIKNKEVFEMLIQQTVDRTLKKLGVSK